MRTFLACLQGQNPANEFLAKIYAAKAEYVKTHYQHHSVIPLFVIEYKSDEEITIDNARASSKTASK